ncbi:hypothetical protein OQA88_1785 [Cercophora sp. LCS_1]
MIPKSVLKVVWFALSVSSSSGHMIMSFPEPYNLNIQPYVQVNPLDGHQYPFPCQNLNRYGKVQQVEAGAATLVQFTGGAQHGGGSCQFSISYDDPAENGWNTSATFKTIYTIIGGCPAHFTDESHNLAPAAPDNLGRQNSAECGNDSGIDCVRQFQVPLPSFLKNGRATFAWTWFNKVGNREMYMNCAPINITGGSHDAKAFHDLPGIFVANVPDTPDVSTCVTGTSSDHVVLNIPNPGINGRILEYPGSPDVKPSNYCPQIPDPSILPSFVSDSRTIQSGASNLPAPNPTALPGAPGMVQHGGSQLTRTVTEMVTVTEHTQTITTTVVVKRPTSTSTELEPTSVDGPMNPGAGHDLTCQTEGAIVCIDTETWGTCDWGTVVPQRVAPGTQCVGGKMIPAYGP